MKPVNQARSLIPLAVICLLGMGCGCWTANETEGLKQKRQSAEVEVHGEKKWTVIPERGLVPDERTAIRIAVAAWSPIYGEKRIQWGKPYHATLRDGVWTVRGSIPKPPFPYCWIPRALMFGGVAEADISQKDGRIIRVFHTK